MRTAIQKVWLTRNRRMVPDGDPLAAVLFARRGQVFPDSQVDGCENADQFFSGPSKPKISPQAKPKEPELSKSKK